uniref:Uncharacterized protein n=1 Tax=Arundo donax TaxID=35708 RepID=A0A0A9ALP9_ARUDO
MRCLGLLLEVRGITPEAQDDYARLFEHPLSRAHLVALSALFGWAVPEED